MIITTLKENPHYKDQVLKEIEREFQYETDHSFNIDFYQLMKHENHANCHLLLDDKEELVSHIGVRPVTLHYKGVDIEVIFLGGIITRKKFQGRGHFKELYNYIIKRYQSQYALAILWSDHSKLYQKLGFSSFGLTAVLGETPVSSALIEQRGFFEASPMELKQIAHLYLESYSNTISVKRTPKDWSDISNITSSKFYIKRDNKLIAKTINPHISDSQNMFKEKIKKRMIGISPSGKVVQLNLSISESLVYAYEKTIFSSTMIFQGVQKLIQGIIPSSEIGGVITIGKVISDASQSSIIALFTITALISVNLGVLNLLPIPALDGGHIMFNIYEMITKRKPSDKVFMFLTITGWVILGSLMLLGIYNDINRIFLK